MNQSTGSSLLEDPQAWSFVLQWAADKMGFPQLVDTMTETFGHRYVPTEWKGIYDRVFAFSDPGEDIEEANRTTLAIAAVEEAMASHGISNPSINRATAPTEKGKGKRKATNTLRRSCTKKRTRSTAVDRFFDIEAGVDDDDDSSEEEEDSNFIVPDADDPNVTRRHKNAPPVRVIASEHAGPSRYQQTVDGIAKRFISSALDRLNDDEYYRQHDEFYGIRTNDEDDEGAHDENSNMRVLNEAGIWEAIRDWIFGSMNYGTLLDLIEFQYDSNLKLQYWEDFLSRLAFINDLGQRESLFLSISLSEHVARIAAYRPSGSHEVGHSSTSPSPEPPALGAPERIAVWAVNITPRSSVDYIINSWKNASIQSTAHELLPGRVSVYATCPNDFLHTVPASHRSCIRGWSLIPFEDRPLQPLLERSTVPLVPGWYTVLKRGRYRGDIGYAIFFDEDSSKLHILVAPRRLRLKSRTADDELGQDLNARRLFSPDIHHARPHSPYRGLQCHEDSRNIFVSGLLLMEMEMNQILHVANPSPCQISLHVASMVDPPFMASTQENYNQLFWKSGDCVTVSDPSHGNKRGNLVSIDHENHSAVVRLTEGSQYDFPLSSLCRLHSVGDMVRVLVDSHSDTGYVHHCNMGRSGIICAVDYLEDEVTVKESQDTEFRVPRFLLESHIPDQAVYAPFSTLTPTAHDCDDSVQIGDVVEVLNGSHKGKHGYVEQVKRLAGTLTFLSTDPTDGAAPGRYEVAISAVTFVPDCRTLKFTANRGYNVRPGDAVIVIRGDHRGKCGVVSQIHLERRLLDVTLDMNCHLILSLPITHCAHASVVHDRDENYHHREKDVIIIAGPMKGWKGTLVSCSTKTCVVARGGRILETYHKDAVVVRGLASTLAGRRLAPLEVVQITAAFARMDTPDRSVRQRTPPPTPLSEHAGNSIHNPWTIDNGDREALNGNDPVRELMRDLGVSDRSERERTPPPGSITPNPWTIDHGDREALNSNGPRPVHEFMRHPDVLKSLERFRAVFQISPGWKDTYTGRLAKTEVPTPFQLDSQPAPPGHLAARFTSRTKGAALIKDNIPETSLEVYRPVKKNSFCMVIKSVDGGEPVGSVLRVTKAASKEQRVTVRRSDGTPAIETSLPSSRVIVVEMPE